MFQGRDRQRVGRTGLGESEPNQGSHCHRGEAFRLRGIRGLGYTASFVDCLRDPQGEQNEFQPIENWPRG
jgi:hypothetical protein